MSRIYENAQEVIVWLGKEEKYSAFAIKSMQRLKFTMESVFAEVKDQSATSLSCQSDFYECQFTDNELVAMTDFFVSYRWFSRIWTVQEHILARKLVFVCGTIIEPLDTILRGSILLPFMATISSYELPRSTKELQWARDFGEKGVMEYVRRKLNEPVSSIGISAHYFRNRQATDPRDKVFAIASISRSFVLPCTMQFRDLTQL
jgi:hypothetical protein